MIIYNLILKKLFNLDNNLFSVNYIKKDEDELSKIFLSSIINKENFHKNKFKCLNEIMNNFYFIEFQNEQDIFFNMFCNVQRIYWILNKFLYNYKYKKSKLIVTTDLQLNDIKLGDENVVCIYHINSKYLFRINDLLKLIYISLTNNDSFFCEPITIKNPYNNIPFNKSILFYIYYYFITYSKINYINTRYIELFLKFKDCNFNITKFVNDYEYLLREYTIINFLNNSTNDVIKKQIDKMIKIYNLKFKNNTIDINDNFPQEILIKAMKPYLHLRLISEYSLIKTKKGAAEKKLYRKLNEFQKFNPKFGRQIIKFKYQIIDGKIKKIKSKIEFNTKYKRFINYEIDNFMNNHLNYKYNPESDDDYDEYDEYDDDDDIESENNITEQYSEYYIFSQFLYNTNNSLNLFQNQTQVNNQQQPEINNQDEENENIDESNEELDNELDEDVDILNQGLYYEGDDDSVV